MSPNVPVRAQMNPVFARNLFKCCTNLISVIFLGQSGLSFDGEGGRKGRLEILETPGLCRSGGTVCLLTSPCANEAIFRANPVHMLYDLTLCHLSWALWPFSSTVRVGGKAESRFWKYLVCAVLTARYVS